MRQNGMIVYKSAVDWFFWSLLTVIVLMSVAMIVLSSDWVGVLLDLMLVAVCLLPMYNMYYAIDDRELIIHFMFQTMRLPIDKISEIRYVRNILSAPALSLNRIAIKFSDRKVLKSSMPLYISPERRSEFMGRLLEINPDIRICAN